MSVANIEQVGWRSAIPNGLTIGRLIAALLFPFWAPGRLTLLLFAGISDLIDGEISRRLGATTDFGKSLDPIADKAVVLAVAGTFLWEGSIEWWHLILVAARDLAVLLVSAYVAMTPWKEQMESSPLVIGKIATGGQFMFLLTVLLVPQAYLFILVIAAVLSLAAAAAYLYDASVQIKHLNGA